MKTLSIVTPCFNEESGIAACYEAVRSVMADALPGYAYEHLFIDNASTDRTVAILRDIAAADARVRVIVNARNFGPTRSPYHAFKQMRGDAMTTVLADLQTPPDMLPAMVALWERGAEVVTARRRNSTEGWFFRHARRSYYRLLGRISAVEQIPDFMGFGLYDRRFVEVLKTLNEPDPYFRGLVSEIGFRRASVDYDQPERRHGKSSYRFRDYANFALLGLTNQSRAPLRAVTLAGFAAVLLSAFAVAAYAAARLSGLAGGPAGTVPVVLAIASVGSVLLLALGIVGEYVGLVLTYARGFPAVVERERINDG